MTPELAGTDCESCDAHLVECTWQIGVVTHRCGRGHRWLDEWLRFRALIPRGVERPRAPGWCPRRAVQLPLWRGLARAVQDTQP